MIGGGGPGFISIFGGFPKSVIGESIGGYVSIIEGSSVDAIDGGMTTTLCGSAISVIGVFMSGVMVSPTAELSIGKVSEGFIGGVILPVEEVTISAVDERMGGWADIVTGV